MLEVYGIATRPPRIKDIKKESKTDVNENIKTEDLRMKLQDSSSRKRKFQEIKEEPKNELLEKNIKTEEKEDGELDDEQIRRDELEKFVKMN